jgi:hypothetical protein
MSEVNGHIPDNPELRPVTNEKGEHLSPLLPEEVKNYLIDIDGTICDDIPNEEPERMVDCPFYPDALEVINRWYDEGHIITFFTSRTEAHRQITETWLDKCGFKYHGLLLGKPRGGNYHWIDNHIVRATRFKGKFTNFIKKTKENRCLRTLAAASLFFFQ